MARLFDDGSQECLEIDVAALSAMPLAMAAWFRSDTTGQDQSLLWVGDKDVANQMHVMRAEGAQTGDPIIALSVDTTSAEARSSAGFTANVWHHAAAIFATATDRRAFLDGGNKGTNATSKTPTNFDRTSIGCTGDSTPGAWMSGSIAEVAIWDLTNWTVNDFETQVIPALAAGFSPLFFMDGLAGYWPLGGALYGNADDKDLAGGNHMTALNTPSTGDHPSIGLVYPAPALLPQAAAAVAAGQPMMRRWGGIPGMHLTGRRSW